MKARKIILVVIVLSIWAAGAVFGVLLPRPNEPVPYVEEPGKWRLSDDFSSLLVQYSNSNKIALIQVPDAYIDEICSDGAFPNCYVDRSKTLLVYNGPGHKPVFWESLDSGGTWKLSAISLMEEKPIDFTYAFFSFCDGQRGWCLLGNDGLRFGETHLLSTSDSGKSWREMSKTGLADDVSVNSITFSNEYRGIITTSRRPSDGKSPIYETTNGGKDWTELLLPLDGSDNVICEGTGASFLGPHGVLQLVRYEYNNTGTSYRTTYMTLCSEDYGESWILLKKGKR